MREEERGGMHPSDSKRKNRSPLGQETREKDRNSQFDEVKGLCSDLSARLIRKTGLGAPCITEEGRGQEH